MQERSIANDVTQVRLMNLDAQAHRVHQEMILVRLKLMQHSR